MVSTKQEDAITGPFTEVNGSEYWLRKMNDYCQDPDHQLRYIRGSRDKAWIEGSIAEGVLEEKHLEGTEVEPIAYVGARCGQFIRDGGFGNGDTDGRTYLMTHQNSCTRCKAIPENESPEDTLLREAQEAGSLIAATPGLEDYIGEGDTGLAFSPFILDLQGRLFRCEQMAGEYREMIERLRELSPEYSKVLDMVE